MLFRNTKVKDQKKEQQIDEGHCPYGLEKETGDRAEDSIFIIKVFDFLN